MSPDEMAKKEANEAASQQGGTGSNVHPKGTDPPKYSGHESANSEGCGHKSKD